MANETKCKPIAWMNIAQTIVHAVMIPTAFTVRSGIPQRTQPRTASAQNFSVRNSRIRYGFAHPTTPCLRDVNEDRTRKKESHTEKIQDTRHKKQLICILSLVSRFFYF